MFYLRNNWKFHYGVCRVVKIRLAAEGGKKEARYLAKKRESQTKHSRKFKYHDKLVEFLLPGMTNPAQPSSKSKKPIKIHITKTSFSSPSPFILDLGGKGSEQFETTNERQSVLFFSLRQKLIENTVSKFLGPSCRLRRFFYDSRGRFVSVLSELTLVMFLKFLINTKENSPLFPVFYRRKHLLIKIFRVVIYRGLLSIFLSASNFLKFLIKKIIGSRKKAADILHFDLRHWQKKLPLGWYRALASFILITLVFSLPVHALTYYTELEKVKNKTISEGLDALAFLEAGSEAATLFKLDQAGKDFGAAAAYFAEAKEEINKINGLTSRIIRLLGKTGDKFVIGKTLVEAGEHIGEAARNLTEGFGVFDTDTNLISKIKFLRQKISLSLTSLGATQRLFNNLNTAESAALGIPKIRQALSVSEKALQEFLNSSEMLLDVLGSERPRRYLLIFENNNEIRPTGGFIGSFALLDVYKGEIQNIEIPGGGSYDLKGSLKELIISPKPLHLISPAWKFHDANWFPDFPASARKIQWFYEKSGGPTTDGVIAITAAFMQELLRVLGPIDMPLYNRIIDGENFITETQKIVELEYDKEENKPKQFLADLAPKVLEKLFKLNKEKVFGLMDKFLAGVFSKQLLFYFTDPHLEAKVQDLGWSGEIKSVGPKSDYLMVVNTNIAGQKTDGVIKNFISHEAEILPDGTILVEVGIRRTHLAVKGEPFSGVRNVNYLRIYVPEGSLLLSSNGFEAPPAELFKEPPEYYKEDEDLRRIEGQTVIHPQGGTRINYEFGKTVFGNWVQVDPGQSVEVTFKYQLPFKIILDNQETKENGWNIFKDFFGTKNTTAIPYTLLIQKQPGVQNTEFESRVRFDKSEWKAVNKYPNDMQVDGMGWVYRGELDRDKFLGVILNANL